MIRITVEIVPYGDESRAKVIGTARIWNTLEGTSARGTYKAEFRDKAGRRWKQSDVQGFPRKRLLAWDLLAQMLIRSGAGWR